MVKPGVRFSRNGSRQERLTATRRALDQDAARQAGAHASPVRRIFEKVDKVAKDFLGLDAAADLRKSDAGRIAGQAGPAFSQLENRALTLDAGLAEEIDHSSKPRRDEKPHQKC